MESLVMKADDAPGDFRLAELLCGEAEPWARALIEGLLQQCKQLQAPAAALQCPSDDPDMADSSCVSDALQLFRTSKALATAVMKHSHTVRVTLDAWEEQEEGEEEEGGEDQDAGSPKQHSGGSDDCSSGTQQQGLLDARRRALPQLLVAATGTNLHVTLAHGISRLWPCVPKAHITQLSISGAELSGDILQHQLQLQECTSLECLIIDGQLQLSKEEVASLSHSRAAWALPSLTHLDVCTMFCGRYEDLDGAEGLAACLGPQLTRFTTRSSLSDSLLEALLAHAPNLRHVTCHGLDLRQDHSQANGPNWQQLDVRAECIADTNTWVHVGAGDLQCLPVACIQGSLVISGSLNCSESSAAAQPKSLADLLGSPASLHFQPMTGLQCLPPSFFLIGQAAAPLLPLVTQHLEPAPAAGTSSLQLLGILPPTQLLPCLAHLHPDVTMFGFGSEIPEPDGSTEQSWPLEGEQFASDAACARYWQAFVAALPVTVSKVLLNYPAREDREAVSRHAGHLAAALMGSPAHQAVSLYVVYGGTWDEANEEEEDDKSPSAALQAVADAHPERVHLVHRARVAHALNPHFTGDDASDGGADASQVTSSGEEDDEAMADDDEC